MDIDRLLDSIRNWDLERNNIEVRIYFLKKNSSTDYEAFSPTMGEDLQKDLLTMIRSHMTSREDYHQRVFSPIGNIEGYVETCPIFEVPSFEHVIRSIDDDLVPREKPNRSIVKELKFYILKVVDENENEILFFRRITKFNKLSKGIIGRFTHGDFEKLSSDLFGIDNNIDIVSFENELLILNHISLERIFSLQETYAGTASQTLDIVERANRISNFDTFREDCLSDARITRALTKMLEEEEQIELVFENFENVIHVIDIFNLQIEIIENNTVLQYEDKSQLMDITRLIRDSFYRSIINQRQGVDERV